MRTVDVKLFLRGFDLETIRMSETYLCPRCGQYHEEEHRGAAAVAARLIQMAQQMMAVARSPSKMYN